jgi:hypothetical protein
MTWGPGRERVQALIDAGEVDRITPDLAIAPHAGGRSRRNHSRPGNAHSLVTGMAPGTLIATAQLVMARHPG